MESGVTVCSVRTEGHTVGLDQGTCGCRVSSGVAAAVGASQHASPAALLRLLVAHRQPLADAGVCARTGVVSGAARVDEPPPYPLRTDFRDCYCTSGTAACGHWLLLYTCVHNTRDHCVGHGDIVLAPCLAVGCCSASPGLKGSSATGGRINQNWAVNASHICTSHSAPVQRVGWGACATWEPFGTLQRETVPSVPCRLLLSAQNTPPPQRCLGTEMGGWVGPQFQHFGPPGAWWGR